MRQRASAGGRRGLRRSVLLCLVAFAGCVRDVQPLLTLPNGPAVRQLTRVSEYVGLSGAAVSPDGRYLLHTDWTTGDLSVRDLGSGQSRRITNNGPLSHSVEFAEFFMRFSTDGQRVAYIWDRNGYQLELANLAVPGRGRFIYRNPPRQGEVLAYDWSEDGRYIAAVVPASAAPGALRLVLIEVADGSVIHLRNLEGLTHERMRDARMSFSPDTLFLAFDLPAAASTRRDIFIRDLRSGAENVAVSDPGDDRLFDWTPDGNALLFWSDRAGRPAVWLQRAQSGVNIGAAQRIAELRDGSQPLGFDRDGNYYFAVPESRRHEVVVATLDLQRGTVGEASLVSTEPGPRSAPEWSPDGRFLAFLQDRSIVIRSVDSGEERRLETALPRIFTVATGEQYLRWSPDGRYLLVPQNRTLFRVDALTGTAIPFVTDRRSRYGRWSPDGTAIFYTRQSQANDAIAELVRMDLATQNKEVINRPALPGDHYASLELSPDGRWLAYSGVAAAAAPEVEATTLMLVPASGGPARVLLQASGQDWIKVVGWTPDSGEILFTRGGKLREERSAPLWRIPVNGGEPRAIDVALPVLHAVRFHPDGRRIAFDSGRRGFEVWTLEPMLRQP